MVSLSIYTVAKLLQLWKASSPILVKLLGKVILVSLSQSRKAEEPILVKLVQLLKSILVSPLHP